MRISHFWTGELDMSIFSERLKLLRSARNITQARLAELLAVDARVYNRWERGTATPQFDTVVKIADILQVHIPAEHEHPFWFNVNADSGRT